MHDGESIGKGDVVLSFDGVTIPSTSSNMTGVEGVSFEVRRGEVMLVRVEEGREQTPLADAAQGLVAPLTGRVCFMGDDWLAMSAHRQAVQRGRTRRVFEHYGWISNLDVMENLCLSESYHTGRHTSDIVDEAQVLARRCGLEGVPEGRPARLHPMMLRRLEWVRAFMGAPALVLLERPLFGAPRADMGKLVDLVCAASRNGAAVIWVTDEDRAWDCKGMGSVRRFMLTGEKLVVS
jgi:phospholipid/cholesterol/gamma-HCH transport system ATP-binding protein